MQIEPTLARLVRLNFGLSRNLSRYLPKFGQFILGVCAAAENRKNQLKPLILEVQGLS